MAEINEEMNKEAASDLTDIIFEGRGKTPTNVGEPDSLSLENLSKKVLVRSLLEEEIVKVEEKIRSMAIEGNFEHDGPLEKLISLARMWKAMNLLTSEEEQMPEVYILDILFLKECYRSLFAKKDEKEEEVFLAGVKTGKLNVLTRKVEIDTESSEKRVEDEPESSYRNLRKIDRNGMPFLGAFHSHPNFCSPEPSDQDLEQFETYEDHGFRTLGGVFTRGGLVKFFTYDLDFEVMITGNGVEKKKGKLYKIEDAEI